jgi:hypothetical protein
MPESLVAGNREARKPRLGRGLEALKCETGRPEGLAKGGRDAGKPRKKGAGCRQALRREIGRPGSLVKKGAWKPSCGKRGGRKAS